jgi:hypothetical protein
MRAEDGVRPERAESSLLPEEVAADFMQGGVLGAARALLTRLRAGLMTLEEATRLLLELLRMVEERVRRLAWLPGEEEAELDVRADLQLAGLVKREIVRNAALWLEERLRAGVSSCRVGLAEGLKREFHFGPEDALELWRVAGVLLGQERAPRGMQGLVPRARVDLEEARRLLLPALEASDSVSLGGLAGADRSLLVALFLVALSLVASDMLQLSPVGEARLAPGACG